MNQEPFLAEVDCIYWKTVVSNFSNTKDMTREWSPLLSVMVEAHAPMREMSIWIQILHGL